MKVWAMLLALVPLMPTEDFRLQRAAPCVMAIAVDVRATLAWGSIEWHMLTSEVERTWAPYGVTFCWLESAEGCEGVQIRVRVLIADDLPGPDTADRPRPVGRILFEGSNPGSEISLSVTGARHLVARARLCGRSVASLPEAVALRLLPRVLGRALAHEIGHYLLGSREHTRSGLMASGFRPDDVTSATTSQFELSRPAAAIVHERCTTKRLTAR
jgi:hypothetical protein